MPKCTYESCLNEATHLAPQVTDTPGTWAWLPICTPCLPDWWEGSDYPDGEGAPDFRPIYGYKAFFNGRQADVHAASLYAAKLAAIALFKPRKSQAHMVHVYLCADGDRQVVQSTAF